MSTKEKDEEKAGYKEENFPWPDISMSLCGGLDDPENEMSEERFLHSLVTFDEFSKNPGILHDPRLVFSIHGNFLKWDTASSMLTSLMVYNRELPEVKEENIPIKMGKKKFSFWKKMKDTREKCEKKINEDIPKKKKSKSYAWWNWRRDIKAEGLETHHIPPSIEETAKNIVKRVLLKAQISLIENYDKSIQEDTEPAPLDGQSPHKFSENMEKEDNIKKTVEETAILRECMRLIKLKESEEELSKHFIMELTKKFTDFLQKDYLFNAFYDYVLFLGSSFSGLKVGRADEYDIYFVLRPPPGHSITYKKLPFDERFFITNIQKVGKEEIRNVANLATGLTAEKLKLLFRKLVIDFIRNVEISGLKMEYKPQKTAVPETILVKADKLAFTISVDFNIIWPVPLDYVKNCTFHKIIEPFCETDFPFLIPMFIENDYYFKITFMTIENTILQEKPAAKPVIKILKVLSRNWQLNSIQSYVYKTIIMKKILENPENTMWEFHKGINILKESLREVLQGLEKKEIKSAFMEENLIEDIQVEEIERMKILINGKLQILQNDKNSLLKEVMDSHRDLSVTPETSSSLAE